MNKIFMLLVAIAAMWCVSCSKDDDDKGGEGEGVITMITKKDEVDLDVFSFKEGEIITVDWGDGTMEDFKTYAGDSYEDFISWEVNLKHIYSNINWHKITIKGSIDGLECDYNDLTSLDVRKCTTLTYLYCDHNDLTSLDVSKNTALEELHCGYNNLTSLDVSRCTELVDLYCYSNNLISLDVSKNTALEGLYCGTNPLTSLDVSRCTVLESLYCNYNNLSASVLNKIFNDLPMVTYGYLSVEGNPGSTICNTSIAENKGWHLPPVVW